MDSIDVVSKAGCGHLAYMWNDGFMMSIILKDVNSFDCDRHHSIVSQWFERFRGAK